MITVVDTGNKYGTMNTSTMPNHLSAEAKKSVFMGNRNRAGKDYGFDGHKMFMADQNDKTGTYFQITPDYVEANPDGWTDIKEDILIITSELPGVAIGHPVADCPVIVMEDIKQGVCAVAHCSAALIDKKMPMMIADALVDVCSSKDEDILAYISACAGQSWKYDCYPSWATDETIWNNVIIREKNNIFRIDLRKAIKKQLEDRKILKTIYNLDDTITNPNYYSNYAASEFGLNREDKYGRNFAGAFYKVKK